MSCKIKKLALATAAVLAGTQPQIVCSLPVRQVPTSESLTVTANGLSQGVPPPQQQQPAATQLLDQPTTVGFGSGTGATGASLPTLQSNAPAQALATESQVAAGATSCPGCGTFNPKKLYTWANFLTEFSFEGSRYFYNEGQGHDPTNGFVNYVDDNTARLVNSPDNKRIRIDVGKSIGQNADGTQGVQAVRMQSTDTFGPGSLIIIDVNHIPAEAGTWPAFWMVESEAAWKTSGEIDIIEGYTRFDGTTGGAYHSGAAQSTVHTGTAAGTCTIPTPWGGRDCAASSTGQGPNIGCFMDAPGGNSGTNGQPQPSTFGTPFNMVTQGGTFAMAWTASGIRTYFWKRGDTTRPFSITGQPITVSNAWGTPITVPTYGSVGPCYGEWPFGAGTSCVSPNLSSKMHLIINTDICGDMSYNGDCVNTVKSRFASWQNAHWDINYIATYTM